MSDIWNPAQLGFPQRYGPDDTLGAANEITPEKVREAVGLVKEGRAFRLTQILDENSPAQMWRYWKHALLLDRVLAGRWFGANDQSFLEEAVAGALHSGTHLDGLAHIGIGEHTYNGHRYVDVVDARGLTQLGIEHVPPIVTRGVLLDVAGVEGVEMLGDTQAITADQLERAAAAQGVEPRAGDVLLIHTGWSLALGRGRRALHGDRAGHRARRRPLVHGPPCHRDRRRQLGGRGGPERAR